MNENDILTHSKPEVSEWIDKLIAGADNERRRAASELSRLGIWTRGSVRTRGSLAAAAKNLLPEPAKLDQIEQYLKETDKDVRCQIALALGEWGGQDAARVMKQLLQTETDEEVQFYYITGLRTIGGPTAVEGLRWAVKNGTEAVCDAAISALEELATGGRIEDTESPVPAQASAHTRGTTRVQGAVRTRAARQARRAQSSNAVASAVTALQQVRDDNKASGYLRLRADEVLGHLK